ncbi:MAG: 50S ribosomal protein L10 [Sulfurovum sp.]|nr:50S ribosomal protein L10 [Sulfurovum sp.]MCB4747115.1 50S ribosomal protein L10 [Sulfurovum sp.]MCB4750359.1 50S ribosomal protein L10 [Sulfurovum sp.]MCB4751824.1 50S ribosomal protein L10 [Sulfurovum sp.]MCB4754672.1 50S ribosomal protein L10 [Sulfurovum sp.]
MTRTRKEELVAEMTAEFKGAGAIIVCNYKGMTVEALETVRNMAREEETKVKVIKNRLASVALENAGCEALELKDTNLVIWGDTQVLPCKVADKAAIQFKEHFSIKSGLIEGKIASMDTINAMAKLPTRDELLGMLLNVWNAPIQNFTIGLKALADKKEVEEEA